jgi:hypothetical protein
MQGPSRENTPSKLYQNNLQPFLHDFNQVALTASLAAVSDMNGKSDLLDVQVGCIRAIFIRFCVGSYGLIYDVLINMERQPARYSVKKNH